MRIAFVNFDIDKYLFKFAEKISQKYSVVSFMGYRKPKQNSILKNYDFLDATHLYHVDNFEKQYDEKLLIKNKENYLKYFLIFSKIMDRVSPKLHSSNYKELYFWKLINFFSNYISEKKIDVLFFDCTPHRPWDFVLFLVAKNLEKKTLIFRRTEIIGKNLIVEDFENDKLKFNFEYKDQEDYIFLNILNNRKYNIFKDYLRSKDSRDGLTMIRYNTTNNLKILSKKNIFYNILYRMIGLLKIVEIKYILFDVIFKKLPIQKVGATENSNPNSTLATLKKPNKIDLFFIKSKVLRRHLMINKLNKINKNFELNDIKYIFFPLPYQPERTTLPESGINSSVINCLKFLSSNLPENIKIIVKEHPRQLYKDIRSLHFREETFYEELLKIKNLILVNVEDDYNKLISNSVMTSALCGSIIFDGLLLGKPSLVFGSTWLSNCKSVQLVNFEDDIKTMILKFLDKTEHEVKNELFDFLINNQKFLINAACDEWEIERFNLDEEKNLEKLVSAAKKRIENLA